MHWAQTKDWCGRGLDLKLIILIVQLYPIVLSWSFLSWVVSTRTFKESHCPRDPVWDPNLPLSNLQEVLRDWQCLPWSTACGLFSSGVYELGWDLAIKCWFKWKFLLESLDILGQFKDMQDLVEWFAPGSTRGGTAPWRSFTRARVAANPHGLKKSHWGEGWDLQWWLLTRRLVEFEAGCGQPWFHRNFGGDIVNIFTNNL